MSTVHEPKTFVLLNAARGGDDEAWRKIYARYRRYLVYVVQMRLQGRSRRSFDEEDVLQSAFASACQRIGDFEYRGEGSLLRWLTQILLNEFRNRLRAQQNERDEVDSGALDGSRVVEHADAKAESPSEVVAREETEERMRRAFDALDPDDQMVIGLRHGQKLAWAQIGEVLGCSRTTAAERFSHAVRELQRLLQRSP